jgi:ubiquinone/menaquinone biosynthesis C-methylase UbiE
MTTMVDQFKETVRQEWTDPATITAWSKWYPQFVIQTRASTAMLLELAQPRPGQQVLDIAGGTGEPGTSLGQAVGPGGHVTITDLSSGMLTANEENARKTRLANLSFQQADAHALPFPDQNFDLVTSRWGVMYFADSSKALGEIYRVLKPGGRVALIAWGPLDRNPFFSSALAPFFKRVEVPPPLAGAPTPFRYAQEGALSSELERAGFKQVKEETRLIDLPWPGPPEELWQHFYDVAVMFHPLFDSLPADEMKQASQEVITSFRQDYDGNTVNLTGCIVGVTAIR